MAACGSIGGNACLAFVRMSGPIIDKITRFSKRGEGGGSKFSSGIAGRLADADSRGGWREASGSQLTGSGARREDE